MPKMIQIRNVPDELHQRLKARAAQARMSLSDYLLVELRQIAERLTLDEWFARVATHPPVNSSLSPADIIREMRDRE